MCYSDKDQVNKSLDKLFETSQKCSPKDIHISVDIRVPTKSLCIKLILDFLSVSVVRIADTAPC